VKPLNIIPEEIYYEALEYQATKEDYDNFSKDEKKFISRVIKKIEFGFGNYSHRYKGKFIYK
jgi:hypothetical protein